MNTKHRRPPMAMQRSAPRLITRVGDHADSRTVVCVASDASVDRYGDILEPEGVQLEDFRRNPIILAQHDSDRPIARCPLIMVQRGQVLATIKFPDAYVNPLSDQYLALIKADVLCGVSVGFLPLAYEPLPDYSGFRYTSWSLLELSIVSVPANPAALIIEKAYRSGAGFEAQRAAHLQRAAEIRRRLGRAEEPAWQLAHAHERDAQIREQRAGTACAARQAVSWW